MDEIIAKTNEKEHPNHAWTSDLNSTLWLWTGMLGRNLQFRSDYFSNFFNKVLLNTLQDNQVFCFVPLMRYHSKTIKLDIQGSSDASSNIIDLQADAGYYPSNAGIIYN